MSSRARQTENSEADRGGGGKPPSPHHDTKKGGAGAFAHSGTADLAAQGFKPKKRGDGSSATAVALVAWQSAKTSGKTQTVVQTGRGFAILEPGSSVSYSQPHMTVSPEGIVNSYKAPKLSGDALAKDDRRALMLEIFRLMSRIGRLRGFACDAEEKIR